MPAGIRIENETPEPNKEGGFVNLESLRDRIPREMQRLPQWILWRDASGRKLPYQIDGRLAKSNDPATWTDFESAAAEAEAIPAGSGGLGFVFSETDEIFGVDLDDCIGPSGGVEKWAVEIIQQLASYSEVSPSGTGVKIFGLGRIPDGRGRKVAVEAGQIVAGKAPAIEVYDRGRYFAVTGDVLEWSGSFGDAQSGLDAVMAKYFAPAKPAPATPAIVASRPDIAERAAAYLRTVDPAVSGQSGHNTTFRAACALVIGFGMTPEEALPLFQEWNERCLPPWSDADLARKLDQADKQPGGRGHLIGEEPESFEAVRQMLKDFGDRSHQKRMEALAVLCPPHLAADDAEDLDRFVPLEAPVFPDECLRPTGWLTDVIDWNLSTAMYPMPRLALAGSLALLATIIGRKLTDTFETRANIYSLGLAPSGSGKEHARVVNKRILQASGAMDRIGPERIGSHSGLTSWVKNQPAILFQLDEISRLFETMKNSSKSPHLYNIGSVLMSLYSSSGSIWIGDAYADAERTPKIDQPHAVIYGTAVPENFWESMTSSNVTDGLLGRFMAFEDVKRPLNEARVPSRVVPSKIITGARFWLELQTGKGNFAGASPEPLEIPHSAEAIDRFTRHMREINEKGDRDDAITAALWSRSGGKAGKLALLFAASRCTNGGGASIELQDVNLAIRLSNYLTRRTIFQVCEHVAENEQVAKKKKVLRLIGNKTVTQHQLTRMTQSFSQREREEILQDLIQAGYLESACSPTKGRTAKIYRKPTSSSAT